MHARQLCIVGFGYVDVKGLTLVYVGPPVCCHVYDGLLWDLPDGLVQGLDVVWDFVDVLKRVEGVQLRNNVLGCIQVLYASLLP